MTFQTPTGRLIHSNGMLELSHGEISMRFQTPTGRLIHSNNKTA